MSSPSVILSDIFGVSRDGSSQQDSPWDKLSGKIKEEIKDIKWPASLSGFSKKTGELLNIKIPDILVASWKKEQAVQDIIDESATSPDETFYIELVEHTIKSEHHPYIELIAKGMVLKKIDFLLSILFKLKGFVLKIKDGTIEEIQTGNCEIEGTFKYQDITLARKELSPIKLPGTIPVNGIPPDGAVR